MRCGAFHRVEGPFRLVRHGQAALSGSKTKAPGFAGGYLLNGLRRGVLHHRSHLGHPSSPTAEAWESGATRRPSKRLKGRAGFGVSEAERLEGVAVTLLAG